MGGRQPLKGLDLADDGAVNKKIGEVGTDLLALVAHCYLSLVDNVMTVAAQLLRERRFIDPLKKAVTQDTVDLEGRSNDGLGQLCMRKAGTAQQGSISVYLCQSVANPGHASQEAASLAW